MVTSDLELPLLVVSCLTPAAGLNVFTVLALKAFIISCALIYCLLFCCLLLQEVEALLSENEMLQGKLHSQEEDFRLQNSTLMAELSKVQAPAPHF